MRFLFIIPLLLGLAVSAQIPPPIQHNQYSTNPPGATLHSPVVVSNGGPLAADFPKGLIRTLDPVNGWLNVRAFGAVGDGSTDDTPAIQQAINAMGDGQTLFFTSGTNAQTIYSAVSLTVPNGKRLTFRGVPGVTIKQAASASNSLFSEFGSNVGQVRFEHITLDGNWQNMPHSQATNIAYNSSIIAIQDQFTRLDCENVIFTNSVRAAISFGGHQANIIDCKLLNLKTNSCDGTSGVDQGIPGNTYGFLGIPQGPFDGDFEINFLHNKVVGQTGTSTNLAYLAAFGFWVSEQTSDPNIYANTNRYKVRVVDNDFIGVGGAFGETGAGAITCYDGAFTPIIVNNRIDTYALSGIDCQRTGFAIIKDNQIRNGFNADPMVGFNAGVSWAIMYSPLAREGSYPYNAGNRTNEVTFHSVISGNLISNFQQTGVYADGNDMLISGNTFDTLVHGNVDSVIQVLQNRVRIEGNTFTDVPHYAITASASNTNLDIIGNTWWMRYQTNTDALVALTGTRNCLIAGNVFNLSPSNNCAVLYCNGLTNCTFADNRVYNSAIAFQIQASSGNCRVERNLSLNSGNDFFTDTTCTNITRWNNSWQAYEFRNDQSAGTFLTVRNNDQSSNSIAAAQFAASATGVDAYYGAYPTNGLNTALAGYAVWQASTPAKGLTAWMNTNHVFLMRYTDNAGAPVFQVSKVGTQIYSTNSTPLILDSAAGATYILAKNQGNIAGYLSFLGGGSPSVNVLNAAGSQYNLQLRDDGQTLLRNNLFLQNGYIQLQGVSGSPGTNWTLVVQGGTNLVWTHSP